MSTMTELARELPCVNALGHANIVAIGDLYYVSLYTIIIL